MAGKWDSFEAAWVYILRCADGSYYTGKTQQDLEHRVGQHNAGYYRGYTFTRRPVVLVFSERFQRITDAIAAERRIKGWSRAKKEALIAGDFEKLQELARGRSNPKGTPVGPCLDKLGMKEETRVGKEVEDQGEDE